MNQLDAMRIFVAVVDSQGFSAASRSLGIPVPTISRNVALLEDHLGVQLLIRTTRKTTVTDSGHRYYEDVRRILEDVASAGRLASGEFRQVKGLLSITGPSMFAQRYILPIVNDFLQLHSGVEVRLLFTNHMLDMLDEHIDLGVRIAAVSGDELTTQPIAAMRQVVCASPDYLTDKGRPLLPEDIASHSTITFSRSGNQVPWNFKMQSGEEYTMSVKSRLIMNAAEGAIESSRNALGLTQLYLYQAIDLVSSGELEIILQEFEIDPVPVSITIPQGQYAPQKVKAFIDFARPLLQARLGQLENI